MELKVRHKSMKAFGESLADAEEQLKIINRYVGLPSFEDKFESIGLGPLTSSKIEIFQVNVGKMCNQV